MSSMITTQNLEAMFMVFENLRPDDREQITSIIYEMENKFDRDNSFPNLFTESCSSEEKPEEEKEENIVCFCPNDDTVTNADNFPMVVKVSGCFSCKETDERRILATIYEKIGNSLSELSFEKRKLFIYVSAKINGHHIENSAIISHHNVI